MERELRPDDNLLRSAFSVREVVRLVNAVIHMPIAQEMANAYLDLLYQKKIMMDAAQIHRLTDDIVTGKYGALIVSSPPKKKQRLPGPYWLRRNRKRRRMIPAV